MADPGLFTLGVEEEFQIVDAKTGELRSHIQQILEEGKIILAENVKAEMHQSVVEMGTDICTNIVEAREQVTRLRKELAKLANKNNLRIAAAGTHPFSHWKDQKITAHPRYKEIISDYQQVARANLIFGLHVHVGVPDREIAIHIMNAARYFLPHIFAISTNSPFWQGRNTGFKSYRSKVFDRFPRTGIPDYFGSLSEYDNYVKLLVKTKCIDDAKKIWWDIRVHPYFTTLEFRICDIPMRIDETICLAAIMQGIVAKLYKLIKQNLGFRLYRRALIAENKWRAARYGIQGRLIDFGKQEEVEFKLLAGELMNFIDDVIDDLGSREEVNYLKKILEMGSGADRQLEVWEQSHDTKSVVEFIVEETYRGLTI
jgi:glutamate---cysteine ligase / carboxylate-amine ligase